MEYIEREAALRVLCDACGNSACPKGLIPRCSYYEKMQSIPAADAIEELQAQIDGWIEQDRNALLKSIPKWIPVTDRLPENDQDVLVMVHWRDYPENMMCYGRKYKTRWYLWNGELGELIKGFDITHWMQLPQPPEEE